MFYVTRSYCLFFTVKFLFWTNVDGGLLDNTSVIGPLRRKVKTIIACVASDTGIDEKVHITAKFYDIAALFGKIKANEQAQTTQYQPIATSFWFESIRRIGHCTKEELLPTSRENGSRRHSELTGRSLHIDKSPSSLLWTPNSKISSINIQRLKKLKSIRLEQVFQKIKFRSLSPHSGRPVPVCIHICWSKQFYVIKLLNHLILQ